MNVDAKTFIPPQQNTTGELALKKADCTVMKFMENSDLADSNTDGIISKANLNINAREWTPQSLQGIKNE